MSVIDWFKGQIHTYATHLVYAEIPLDHQSPAVQDVTLVAERHYFRIWLAEMFLKDDTKLFREFVPVVHSAVRLQFAQAAAQELPYVAGPQSVGLGTTLGRGVQLNHALTNLLPYRGGTVAISAALVAYKQKDFLRGFVDALQGVSGLLNVGQLSAVLKVADGVIGGIQDLLGAGDKSVHLMYFQAFGGATAGGGSSLRSGYTAIINADAAKFPKDKLYVKNSQLCLGDSLAAAQPLQGYDYMLLRTEAATDRDDFLSFDAFAQLLNDAVREGAKDRAAGDAIIQAATFTAWSSPDLTVTDRIRIAKALKQQYEAILGAGEAEPPAKAAASLSEAAAAVSVDEVESLAESLTDDEPPSFAEFSESL